SNTSPERKGLGSRVAGGRESFISGCIQCGGIAGAEIVEGLIKGVIIDDTVRGVCADVAEVGIAGENETTCDIVLQAEIYGRRAVPGDIRDRIYTRPVLREKTGVLKTVARQPVVRVAKTEIH